MKKFKSQLNTNVEIELIEKLMDKKATTGMSISQMVNEAIKNYLGTPNEVPAIETVDKEKPISPFVKETVDEPKPSLSALGFDVNNVKF